MKKFLAGLGILSLVLLAAAPVLAATEEGVTATVTPQVVAVSVSDGDVAYGILAFGDSDDTLDGSALETQTISNEGNVSANIDLKSSDATATTTWDLVAAATPPGTDEFGHQYDINGTSGAAVWADFPATNGYTVSPVVTLGVGGTASLDLSITMPSSSADTSQHSITVTARATVS